MNVYEIVTEQGLKALEQGTVPWQKPWVSAMPANLISQKDYRGINVFMLAMQGYESKFWLTYNQCSKIGAKVRKGEKSSMVVYWNVGEEKLNAKTGKLSKPFMLRYSNVFNVTQCEGIDLPRAVFEHSRRSEIETLETAESLVKNMPNPPTFEKSGAAWYRPSADIVGMPPRSDFHTPSGYYSTLFHELTHATGHASRLHRDSFDNPSHFGTESYSREELIAEMGSAYLCGLSGIERETVPNSAAYLKTWIARLKGDSKLIVGAASAAQKAADYISRNTFASKSDETVPEIGTERMAA